MWAPKDDYIFATNGDIFLINILSGQEKQITNSPEKEEAVSWMQ
jgi:hypothetical protein